MRRDPDDADYPQSRSTAIAKAKRARHPRARTTSRPAGQHATVNLLTSFGMIASLLLMWAIAVTM